MKLVRTSVFDRLQQAFMAEILRTIRLKLAFILVVPSLGCSAQIQSKLPNHFESGHATMQAALEAAGLDIYETQKNHQILAATEKTLEIIKTDLGENYGGDWISYDENKKVHRNIASTKSVGSAQKKSHGIENEIIFVDVKYNYAKLEATYKKIIEIMQFHSQEGKLLIYTSEINVQLNRITVSTRGENFESIQNEFLTAGIDLEMVNFEKGEPVIPTNLLIG